ncbi:MAG: PAS domain S-box protein [Fibrobacterota bacterium]
MNIPALIDITALLCTAAALTYLPKFRKHREYDSTTVRLAAVLLTLTFFFHFSNFLEWSGLFTGLDPVEDYLRIMEPLFWGALMYSFIMNAHIQREQTARRRAAQKAHLWDLTLSSIGDGMIITDGDLTIIRMNHVAEIITGWSAEDARGRRINAIYRQVQTDKKTSAISPEQILHNGIVRVSTPFRRIVTRTGTPVDVSDSISSITHKEDSGTKGVIVLFRNITDQRKAQKRLRESEERFSRIMAAIPDMVSVLDKDLTMLYCNWHGIAKKVPPKERRTDRCYRILKGQDKKCATCRVPEVFKTGREIHYIDEFPRGSWHEIRLIPIFDDTGHCTHVTEWIRNISRQEQRKALLAQQKQHLENIIAGTGAGTWEWNVQTQKTRFNEQWAAMLGFSLHELSPTSIETWTNLVHPEDLKKSEDLLQRHFDGKTEHYEAELRVRCRDGKWRWILDRGKVISRTSHGAPLMMFGIHLDITARKTDEEALRRATERLQALINEAPLAIITLDTEARVIGWNPAAEKLFGWTEQEVRGAKNPIVPPQQQEEFQKDFKTIMKGIPGTSFNIIQSCKDGSGVHVNITSIPLYGADGTVQEVVGIITDITENIRLQEQINRTQRLDSLGIIAGGIAHDFNNLLSGIYGLTEISREESDNAFVRENLSHTLQTIKRARSLTGQLLTFSRGGTPVRTPSDIRAMLREVTHFALSGSGVQTNFAIDPNLPRAMADVNQISQVMENMVINARQAMEGKGTLRITADTEELCGDNEAALPPGTYLCITLEDTGCGIPQEKLAHIFDPFFSTKKSGHGLGLSTCYSIIKQHGGAISAASRENRGTTFSIRIPAHRQSPPPRGEAGGRDNTKEPISPHDGETVLVLDDEEAIRTTVGHILESAGYRAVSFSDGTEVLSYLKETENTPDYPRAMIFDFTIPEGVGGMETLQKIRLHDTTTPVFASSGDTASAAMNSPRDYGFTGAIAKPYRKNELLHCLETSCNPQEELREK